MPLIHGYSEASIHHNIGEMVASGRHTSAQAAAAAFDTARKAYRKKHPRGPLPAYLRAPRGGAKNHAGGGHGIGRTKIVHSLKEFYDAIDGRTLTLDGVHGKIEVERSRHDRIGPLVPSTAVYFRPSARGRKSAAYRETKSQLRDDFSVDLSNSERLFTVVAPRLRVQYGD